VAPWGATTPADLTQGCTSDLELTRELVLSQYDADFTGTTGDLRRGRYLTELICSLEDPWRYRFLDLIAQRVAGIRLEDRVVSPTQVVIWLADQSLARMVGFMLKAWTHEV
jgi:hypothetical protein